ncbi:MAG: 16S rRNA (adenine(1518)-N(6)/adenine(1519)-N(6))-dimethyltransferase RsmA [Bacteroidia bacterium]|jgi:16S rRNA (adenine1518-N6/adenine1519-N6)-dimethyltransferase|nr:16S rRNA (adenine(1518)-N(6)/adenine(1519)-N(6))-dimethyltransferase RsmA [Bacteroidia bacterium]
MNKGTQVRAKKHLGQHFLTDHSIAAAIVKGLTDFCETEYVLEIGPGTGVLTQFLFPNSGFKTIAIDIDEESVTYLKQAYPMHADQVLFGDFLASDLSQLIPNTFSLIGNFPYNISSQIVFKLLASRNQIPLMVGMFQKEVAERLAASPRTKEYGILSVLTQAYYDVTYLFTVDEHVFNPPPKVKSGVIRCVRKQLPPAIDEKWFFKVVKTAFNQRRKKLRNALQQFKVKDELLQEHNFINKRAEELTYVEFIELTKLIQQYGENNG